jgi:hypothetical protein
LIYQMYPPFIIVDKWEDLSSAQGLSVISPKMLGKFPHFRKPFA